MDLDSQLDWSGFKVKSKSRWTFLVPLGLALTVNLLLLTNSRVCAQVSWTPIYVDTSNRLDLWTVTESGCECPNNKSSTQCACCVKAGGCLCTFNQNKCAQCGLEDACQRFCNVSISSRNVATRSGLSWVQIKSPVLEGPTSCWWRLQSAPGQRIEVQIHRLISVGTFDNSSQKCTKGFLQFADGDISIPSSQAIQLCADNSRFSPPVVLFGDQGVATLLLRIDGRTSRSQLLAYASFSSVDDPAVGDPVKGGRLRPHSGCDWTYENCFAQECILASPGYPGLFPPHRRCRYFLSTNGTGSTDKIRIQFHALSLPQPSMCSTHHITIWNVSGTAATASVNNLGTPWKTLCEESQSEIEIEGGQALVEFRSGSTTSPYFYNGFRATVQHIRSSFPAITPHPQSPTLRSHPQIYATPAPSNERSSTSRSPKKTFSTHITTTTSLFRRQEVIREEPMGNERESFESEGIYKINCGHIFEGELTRGQVFRLIIPKDLTLRPRGNIMGFGYNGIQPKKIIPPGPFKCQIEFRGRPADIVQFASFSYRFRGSNCSTVMEVYDMEEERTNRTDRLMGKLCGPSGNEVRRFTSSHSKMALVTLVFPYEDAFASEYLEGAFSFHDESVEGTVKPMSNCEVVYYGVTSAPSGSIVGPPDSPLLRLSRFPLVCAHSFLPGANQSVALILNRAGHDTLSVALPNSLKYCRSICGASGCRCEAKHTSLDQIDHLLLMTGSTLIGCLCGYFRDILPMVFEAHAPLTLVYHATKGGGEFSYSVGFQFKTKVTCANFSISPPSGSKRWKDIVGAGVLVRSPHHYTLFQCIWSISIPPRYRLELEFISEENEEDCRTWNLTVWAGNDKAADPDMSDLLFSFCPKYGRRAVQVAMSVQNAFVKLLGVTLRPPQFEVRWRYIDMLLGQGHHPDKTTANNSDSLPISCKMSSLYLLLLPACTFFYSYILLRPEFIFSPL